MKKTLTVNLGGTVFHIDEDAYQLLDKYLANLRIHFRKEEGSEEIMNDFEMRISELFNERVRLGYEVITIEHVEEVIKRMGKPEELFEGEEEKEYKEEASKLKTRVSELKNEVAQLNEKNAEIKEQTALNKELLEENKKLRNLLKTSLYPGIANELLKEEGLLKSDQQLVTKKYLSENIITSDTKISFEKHTHNEKQTSKSMILEIKDLLDKKTKY